MALSPGKSGMMQNALKNVSPMDIAKAKAAMAAMQAKAPATNPPMQGGKVNMIRGNPAQGGPMQGGPMQGGPMQGGNGAGGGINTGKPFKKGGNVKMKETMGPRNMSQDVEKGSNKLRPHGESAVQKRGHTRGMEEKMPKGPGMSGLNPGVPTAKFSKGGHVGHGEHPIQKKGRTKGRVI